MNYFLVFPKIGGGDGGVLLGEILAALLLLNHVIRRRSFVIDHALLTLIALGFYYFLLSNAPAYFSQGMSLVDLGYFVRFLMVALLSAVVVALPSQRATYYWLLIYPAVLTALISLVLYIVFFLLAPPSISEILWGYRLGSRLIPIFGIAIGPGLMDIGPAGGGSGNLFGTLCTAALLALNQRYRLGGTQISTRRYLLISALMLACAILTLSRAVFITLALLLFVEFRKQLRPATWIFFLSFIAVVMAYFGNELAIFNRLADTFSDGGTDLSTSLRLENYRAAVAAWLETPATLIFGIGSNAEVLTEKIGGPLVESFYLGLLCSAGLLGVALFATFIALVIAGVRQSEPMRLLLKFYIYQSLFLWSVGGGDFWGPVALYVTAVLFGLHYRGYPKAAHGTQTPSERSLAASHLALA